ncbi:hypothetical protein LXA43DRAFT_1099972 [Ganoderma leucocontextum]|nr:hypothetical protein LXA43DRAFT_1099972 [Ganoderma leucocontextum]
MSASLADFVAGVDKLDASGKNFSHFDSTSARPVPAAPNSPTALEIASIAAWDKKENLALYLLNIKIAPAVFTKHKCKCNVAAIWSSICSEMGTKSLLQRANLRRDFNNMCFAAGADLHAEVDCLRITYETLITLEVKISDTDFPLRPSCILRLPTPAAPVDPDKPPLDPEVMLTLVLEEWDRRQAERKTSKVKDRDTGLAASVLSSEKPKIRGRGPRKPVGVCWTCGGPNATDSLPDLDSLPASSKTSPDVALPVLPASAPVSLPASAPVSLPASAPGGVPAPPTAAAYAPPVAATATAAPAPIVAFAHPALPSPATAAVVCPNTASLEGEETSSLAKLASSVYPNIGLPAPFNVTLLESFPELIGYDSDVFNYFKDQRHFPAAARNVWSDRQTSASAKQALFITSSRKQFISEYAARMHSNPDMMRAVALEHRGEVRSQWKGDLTRRPNGTIDPWYGCDVWQEMWDYAFNFTFPRKNGTLDTFDIPDALSPKVDLDPSLFLNDPRVRELDPSFTDPFGNVYLNNTPNRHGDLSIQPIVFFTDLFANSSTQGIPWVFYSGIDDSQDAHRSTEVIIQNFTFGGVQGFARRPATPWYGDDGAVAGVVHQERNVSYVLFDGAGHLIPEYKPMQSLVFLREFILGDNPNGTVLDGEVSYVSSATEGTLVTPSASVASWESFLAAATTASSAGPVIGVMVRCGFYVGMAVWMVQDFGSHKSMEEWMSMGGLSHISACGAAGAQKDLVTITARDFDMELPGVEEEEEGGRAVEAAPT